MQLDEEVGKLASATPVMVCQCHRLLRVGFLGLFILTVSSAKSLECFLQLLVEETAKEARSRGSKKLTAYHL